MTTASGSWLRTCVGCGTVQPRRDLVRIARGLDGWVTLDLDSRSPLEGRGAYLCVSQAAACLEEARRRRRVTRTLRASDDVVDYSHLRALLQEHASQEGIPSRP